MSHTSLPASHFASRFATPLHRQPAFGERFAPATHHPSLAHRFSVHQVSPACRLPSKNFRAHNKKSSAKKSPRVNPASVPKEDTTGGNNKDASEQGIEDRKVAETVDSTIIDEEVSETQNGNIKTNVTIVDDAHASISQAGTGFSPVEQQRFNKSKIPISIDASPVEVQESNESKIVSSTGPSSAEHQELNESKTTSSTSYLPSRDTAEEESFMDIVEDLMQKIQEAERNILMLNKVRIENLEQLEQMRRDKDELKGKVDVLQLKLAETEVRLKATSNERSKIKLLEQEIDTLQKRIALGKETESALSDQNKSQLSEHFDSLQSTAERSNDLAEIEQLKRDKQMLQDQIKSQKKNSGDSMKKDAIIASILLEKELMEKALLEAEEKLVLSDSDALQLAKLKLEKQVERENLHEDRSTESQEMERKLEELQSQRLKLETENEILRQAQTENEELRNQIKVLEQRLVDSDAEIRSQLETYQAEIESFQASLEQLKAEKNSTTGAADVMPWEFWSYVLLSIDGWLLEKQLLLEDAVKLREMAWQKDASIKDVFIARKGSPDIEILSALDEVLRKKKKPGMHIIHIAAEMAPVAKVGGLGDVVTGLGKSLQKKGHLVEIVIPKYDCMDYEKINNLKVLDMDLQSHFDGHTYINKVWIGTVDGLPVYFIEPYHPGKLFWRGTVYGENDDFARFSYFSRAALEFVLQAAKKPDIIHCHDWHTAAVAPLYWNVYASQGLNSARIAFTCHNFEYQGTEFSGALASCGLDPHQMHRPDRMQDNFLHDRINLLKGGIVFSNVVTTVSPTYAQEVQTAEGGKGLHLTLRAHSHKFFGILNGIDTESWNPASDLLIEHQYNADDIGGKAANKRALRAVLGLAGTGSDTERSIVGCVTRLVPQKGVHLIRHAIYRTVEQGGQFVLLGSSPIPQIQNEFEAISQQFSNHPHVRLILKYDESLSHLIYAGSDIFVIPSIFEPCGLTQMIAMRYGAIPIVRQTGGLNDSVFDVDDETIPWQRRNGFTFVDASEQGLQSALDRALNYCAQRRLWWQELIRKAMQADFSWNSSADQYAELYENAIARARARSTFEF